jgi:xylose isomerase
MGTRTLDLAYGDLRKTWDPEVLPTLVLWNGSWGYDLVSPSVRDMYQNLKEGIAELCREEARRGGLLPIGIEPKPNEGHPALLLPTTASAILFWRKLEEEFGISRKNKGTNKEIGHSEMIGLDPVYDTMEELDQNAVMHVHLNSQGYNDGLIHGGPGKYDIDHGTRINGFNVAMARLYLDAGYSRWYGHDMQVRPYDSEEQGIDRVVRSILSWEACLSAARDLDMPELTRLMLKRETAKAEDLMRQSVQAAYRVFDEVYEARLVR